MNARRTAVTLGLTGGLLLLGPAAWADDGSGTTPSSSAQPSTEPSANPTPSATDEPTTKPTDQPTGEPTDGPTGEPPDGGVCHGYVAPEGSGSDGSDGTVTSDGGEASSEPAPGDPSSDDPATNDPKGEPADNPCIYYAAGAGSGGQDSAAGAGASERDAKGAGRAAAELPRTGGRTDILALVAFSLLAAGGMSLVIGRRSAA